MRKLSEIQTDFDKAMEAENGADNALKYLKELNNAKEELKTLLIEIPLERLQEIALAEKAGTLIILPCKVGDTVYRAVPEWEGRKCLKTAFKPHVEEFKVVGFYTNSRDEIIAMKSFEELFIFGKTVFLTKEAATEALESDRL